MAKKVDSNIGSLPKTTYLADDSLLVAEQQGEAVAVTGELFKQFARDSVTGYVGSADEHAKAAANSAKSAAQSAEAAQTAKAKAENAATSANSAKDDAIEAAESATATAATAEAAAAKAAKSEANANTSATNAASSKEAAEKSATASEASNKAAKTSADEAGRRADEAVNAAAAAAQSATQAENYKDAAASSETNARTSATTASNAAINASGAANSANISAGAAQAAMERVENMGVKSVTLVPGTPASVTKRVSVDAVELEFGIPTGRDGVDGVPATHHWEGTKLVVTSASGTTSADLKGDPGENGIIAPVNGFFTLSIDANGNLWANFADEGTPLEFEYDTETGDFYIIQEVEE